MHLIMICRFVAIVLATIVFIGEKTFIFGQTTYNSEDSCTYSFVVPRENVGICSSPMSDSRDISQGQNIKDLQEKLESMQNVVADLQSKVKHLESINGETSTSTQSHNITVFSGQHDSFAVAYRDCQDVHPKSRHGLIYKVYPVNTSGPVLYSDSSKKLYHRFAGYPPFNVYCKFFDLSTLSYGWTVLQRRTSTKLSYNRTREEYKNGFGDLNGDFWLGLEKMHRLTKHVKYAYSEYVLQIVLTAADGVTVKTGQYENVRIGSEAEKYKLTHGTYTGNAGGYLGNNVIFTTKEDGIGRVNSNCDGYSGWWFHYWCVSKPTPVVNLNHKDGPYWVHKYLAFEMKIRRRT